MVLCAQDAHFPSIGL